MDVLYRTSHFEEWTQIVDTLKREYGWKPRYWVSHPEFKEKINTVFPETIFHSKYNANRSCPPDTDIEIDPVPLDRSLLRRYRKYRPTILRLMDRMDLENSFTYDERVRNYHRVLQYWLAVFDRFNIDLVVFARIPHGVADNVIYAICSEKEIPTPMFRSTVLPEIQLVVDDVHETNPHLQKICSDGSVSVNTEKLSKKSTQHLENLRGEYTKPTYMKEKEKLSNKYPYISQILNPTRYSQYVKKLAEPKESDHKVSGKTPEDSTPSLARHILYKQKGRIKKFRLERMYEKLAKSPDYTKKYIYIPLHYQPERTTVPEGNVYHKQYLMVNLLSKTIPNNWNIYVKEHPSQFSPATEGELGRWKYDYRDIMSINNVSLVTTSADSFELIDNSEVVATVTGTAGWEAVVRGTPSIVFGNAWYRCCNGVFYVNNHKELKDAINEIGKISELNYEDVLKFVRSVEIAGYRCYQSNNWPDANNMSTENNIQTTVEALYNFVNDYNSVQRS